MLRLCDQQTLMVSPINSSTVVTVLNISQKGISLFCHKIRLCSSDYSKCNTQPAGENYACAYLCIFKPEYLNVEHSPH